MSGLKKEYFENKKRKSNSDHGNSPSKKSKMTKKLEKQSAQIATLQAEVKKFEEKSKVDLETEIATVLKQPVQTQASEDKSRSMIRQVMAIVARRNKE